MRRLIFTPVVLITLLMGCSKQNTTPPDDINPNRQTTTGNITNYNGYLVKTIGISRILLAVEGDDKFIGAYLYGGGNKIALKAGLGNTIEVINPGVSTLSDNLISNPSGNIGYQDKLIDNGTLPDTSANYAVVKLRGFDKSKTGYNQLNLVMQKYMFPAYYTNGYYPNISYLTFNAKKKNAEYSGLLKTLLSGNVNVSSVEIAAPLADNAEIVEDWAVGFGRSRFNEQKNAVTSVDIKNTFQFNYISSQTLGVQTTPVAKNLKFEWVNANNGVVSKLDDYIYAFKLNNVKAGPLSQIIEASDVTTKAYLKVSGFNKQDFGFTQLRFFPAESDWGNGAFETWFGTIRSTPPTLEFMKGTFLTEGLITNYACPISIHY